MTIRASNLNASEHESLLSMDDFNRCISPSDSTHVGMETCSHWCSNTHKRHKLNTHSRTYNMTVKYTKQVLCKTSDLPVIYSDQRFYYMIL